MAKTNPPALTDAQREIMNLIWQHGELSVSEVRENLDRELARNTVQTVLVRLEEKGWLKHRKRGRTFFYYAARPKSANLGEKVTRLIDRFFSGSPEEMVTALIEHRGLSPEEATRIRKMIRESERKSDRTKREK